MVLTKSLGIGRMPVLPLLLSFLSYLSRIHGFHVLPSHFSQHHRIDTAARRLPTQTLFLAKKKKGFSNSAPPEKKKKKSTSANTPTITTASSIPTTTPPAAAAATAEDELTPGERALAKLRAEAAEKERSEIEKIREVRSVDEFVRDDPTAAVIPEKVAMRMGRRMLPFVGVPLFGGMATFVAFWYFATYKNVQFQPALVAFSTIGLLGVGLVGITYSVMSASWDPDREGSALGGDEFSKNLDSLKDGLKRSRENAITRDRMAAMPEKEIEKAVRDLDKKDDKEKMKTMSLQEKMERELE